MAMILPNLCKQSKDHDQAISGKNAMPIWVRPVAVAMGVG